MHIKHLAAALCTLLMGIAVAAPVQACTIFTAEQGDTVLTGNNEDWMYSCETFMTVSAPEQESYGMVCFYNSSYVQGGMNEYGLFYDGASCPATVVPYDAAKQQLKMDFGELVLSKCTTVKEAVEMLKNSNIPSGFCDHLLFADASGDSAVLEWMEDSLHIINKDSSYQLVTNFWLTDPALGGYPCGRYSKAEEFLKEQPTIDSFASILDATKQDWGNGGTLYSNIYDLTKREVYVYYKGALNAAHKINLTQQLKGMQAGEKITTSIKDLTFDVPCTITAEKVTEEVPMISSLPVEKATEEVLTTSSLVEKASVSSVPETTQAPQKLNGWVLVFAILAAIAVIAWMMYRRNKGK